ncbi:MAG TPA: hypothetical protein VFS42_02665 [Burkholderiaceae bacterium]|nr:hypothetical protein [Burkholderiaceae bacterium]
MRVAADTASSSIQSSKLARPKATRRTPTLAATNKRSRHAVDIDALERGHAAAAEQRMLNSGSWWPRVEHALRASNILQAHERLSLERLSSINLDRLLNSLTRVPCSPEESLFLDGVLARSFHVRYDDRDDRQPCLPGFAEEGDDDYVQLTLECDASDPRPEAPGATTFHRRLTNAHALNLHFGGLGFWGVLNDSRVMPSASSQRYLAMLSPREATTLAAIHERIVLAKNTSSEEACLAAARDVFIGRDFIHAAGLAVVLTMREIKTMDHALWRKLYRGVLGRGVDNAFSLGALVNILLRPRIRVPRFFVGRP